MADTKGGLPRSYLKWLSKVGKCVTEDDGREWNLAGPDELAARVKIDGKTATYLEQANLYVRTIVAMTGESPTVDGDGNPIAFDRVAQFLTIGYSDEDLLCVDPHDGFSVWVFHPTDGGDVERLADSLDAWTKRVELVE